MKTADSTKASDESQILRDFVLALQNLYGQSVPKIEMPVLETMLFGVCLEDNYWTQAEAAFKKLITSYFDVNKTRVTSTSDLEQTLAPLKNAGSKCLLVQAILRYVSESTRAHDFETLRSETYELAVKTLNEIPEMSPFVRDFILKEVLGSHVVCLDHSMLTAARWLGLVPRTVDVHDASEFLKSRLRQAEVSKFCYLLRCLATDPKFIPRFTDMPDHELSMAQIPERLVDLRTPPKKKPPSLAPPLEPAKPAKTAAPHSGIGKREIGTVEIAVIDLETTGFSPDAGDRIIEIGIVFLNEKLDQVRTFQSLVNPQRSVRDTVHGISNEDLRGQPTFSELFKSLVDQLRDTSCLVAHNVGFEKKFLLAEFSSLNFSLPSRLHEICTMKAAKELGIGSNQKLQTLIKELKIEVTGPSHRAIPDALATAELLRHLYRSKLPLPALHPIEWTSVPIHDFSQRKGGSTSGTTKRAAELKEFSDGLCDGKWPKSDESNRPMKSVSSVSDVGQRSSDSVMSKKSNSISRPVQILISKLESEDKTAQRAAEALIDQARRNGAKLDEAVGQLAPFLRNDNYNVRAAVANVLGHIGTRKAIEAISTAFESSSAEDLATQCNFNSWSEESLSYWFAEAIGENETKLSARALVSLLLSKSLPDAAKAGVMIKLACFDIDELNVKLPSDIVDTLEKFASSDDPKLSEGAISMLGNI